MESQLHTHIAHSVAEIAPESWEALSGGAPFQSQRWYRFGEAVMADCPPTYVTVLDGGRPAARASLWLVRDEPLPVQGGPLREATQAYLRRRPLMLCRSPLSSMPGVLLRRPPEAPRARFELRGRESAESDAATRALVSAAREQARLAGASFLVFDFLTPELGDLAACTLALGEAGDPGTLMELPWGSFDEFLAGLGKNGRKHYRRTVRRAEELGITVSRHRTVERIPEALDLIRGVERRYGSAPNPWMRGMMEQLEMVAGTWLAATIGQRLVGCELVLQDNGAQAVTALGLAPDVPYAYFALGYEDIRLAIETGMRTLYWGSGAYEVKERLGFRTYPNNLIAYAGLGLAPRLIARAAAVML